MSESTFLGTPLTKYDIDDFEVQAKSKRARSYLESKQLKHRQNRELINRNKLKTLYTVDTEEGWTPAEFKSSRTKRATYTFQTLSTFTDQDDADIVSLRVLNSIKLREKEAEINRIVKGILNNEGLLRKVYGPQLPQTQGFTRYRDPADLRGVEFTEDVSGRLEPQEDEDRKEGSGSKKETRLKWIASTKDTESDLFSTPGDKLKVNKEDYKTWHKFDRDVDLGHIRQYYKSYYEFIVKPLEEIKEETMEDLVQKYTKMPEFTKSKTSYSSMEERPTKQAKNVAIQEQKFKDNFKGRTVTRYEFSKELLGKFKIKPRFQEVTEVKPQVAKDEEKEEEGVNLPIELFSSIFGKM